MAKKRMFHTDIIDSDEFIALPASAQNLYFRLGAHTDDEGFITGVKQLLWAAHGSEDDLQTLIDAGYILDFPDSSILLQRHFFLCNELRRDRVHATTHARERAQVLLEGKVYERVPESAETDSPEMAPEGPQEPPTALPYREPEEAEEAPTQPKTTPTASASMSADQTERMRSRMMALEIPESTQQEVLRLATFPQLVTALDRVQSGVLPMERLGRYIRQTHRPTLPRGG